MLYLGFIFFMKSLIPTQIAFCIVFIFLFCQSLTAQNNSPTYPELEGLFKEWRSFETPPFKDGAPDYSKETFQFRNTQFKSLRNRLYAIDTSSWAISEQVDWHIVRAEMNGYLFNDSILKPWERDPAFYKSVWTDRSDVPAHEGPTHHSLTELWTYDFPLDRESTASLIASLEIIPSLNIQAQRNLTGNAKDLWITGIRDIRQQIIDLEGIKSQEGVLKSSRLLKALDRAIFSTQEFVHWLEENSTDKTGPSGIGKEAYTWYLQNVHLVPLSWEDELMLLKRELTRAWSSLKLEEHRNRKLPLLTDAKTPEEYLERAEASAESLIHFLREHEMVTVKDYFMPVLKTHLGGFVPKEKRNFFWITAHYDQRPLYSHFYHWFELARMDMTPHKSEIRKGPLLYNIFDSRNEGLATAVEEMFMSAGLYDQSPRSREIVYIMIAQRAARGIGSLYAHANEMTMEEAGSIHSEFTPRSWMKTEEELLIFEQHLYLRQPGYGSSYITGKYLVEEALAEFARLKEKNKEVFKIKDFFNGLNAIGNIPISLGQWELTQEKPLFYKKLQANN